MAKEKHSGDKITEQTLHEILLDIKYRLNHLEDITADDRSILIKLVKQSNQIVEFLSQIDIEPYEDDFDEMGIPPLKNDKSFNSNKVAELKELFNQYMNKHKDLKEFRKELEKHKKDITPGQIGEA
jgi:ribosomal protein S15P/S13E